MQKTKGGVGSVMVSSLLRRLIMAGGKLDANLHSEIGILIS
jgi:hypothetical protein